MIPSNSLPSHRSLCGLLAAWALAGYCAGCGARRAHAAEVFVLTAGDRLPAASGPAADAYFGDYVLSNLSTTAVVLSAATDRQIPPGFPLERGDLIDFQVSNFDHDQLIAYRLGWEGPGGAYATLLTGATAVEAGPGEAAQLVLSGHLFDPHSGRLLGVDVVHQWSMAEDAPLLDATTWVINRGREAWKFRPSDCLYAEGLVGAASGATPLALWQARRPRYALGVYAASGPVVVEPAAAGGTPWTRLCFGAREGVTLPPGSMFSWSRRLVVQISPSRIVQLWTRERADFPSALAIAVTDRGGRPVAGVPVRVLGPDWEAGDPTNADGEFGLVAPSGSYTVLAERPGCRSVSAEAELFEGQLWWDTLVVEDPAVLALSVVDKRGGIPARVAVLGVGETPDPTLEGQSALPAHDHCAYSPDGRFRLALPAGRYRVVASHGPEYALGEKSFDLAAGRNYAERFKLKQVVDTDGWTAACLSTQTRRSGTSLVTADDRLVGLAAEGLRFVVAGERERAADWSTSLRRQRLSQQLWTAVGVELPHPLGFPLLAWPLDAGKLGATPSGFVQLAKTDPYAAVEARAASPECLFQRVCASLPAWAREGRLMTGLGRAGREGVLLTDLLPTGAPVPSASLLANLGASWAGAGGAAGSLESEAGCPRCYLPVDPAALARLGPQAVVAALTKGEVVLTNGPFIHIEAERLKRKKNEAAAPARLRLEVRCPEWIKIDHVVVVGTDPPGFAREFSQQNDGSPFHGGGGAVFSTEMDVPVPSRGRLAVLAYGPPGGMAKGTFAWDRRRPAALRLLRLP